jgi:hypothetical protein
VAESPANEEQVPLHIPSRESKNEGSIGGKVARYCGGPNVADIFPASVESSNSFNKEKVEARSDLSAGWGELGETRAETAKAARDLGKNDPEMKNTVRTPYAIVAFATGIALEILNPTKPSPSLNPNPSTGTKETVRLYPGAALNPKRVMTKEPIFCNDMGVNEMLAVTLDPETLEFSFTSKSNSDGVMPAKYP